jgi:5-methylcytosine-specific restriction endonuclease McrA
VLTPPPTPGKKARRRARVRALVASIKDAGSCALCGATGRDELTFHHVGGRRTKRFDVGRASLYSMGAVRREIAKCALLCIECHRGLHRGEVDGSGLVPMGAATEQRKAVAA